MEEQKREEQKKQKRTAGFTLVELLVVVAIIGILSGVAVTGVMGHLEKTRITATRATIQTISQALTTYSLDHNGKLPDSLDPLMEGTDDNPPLIENNCQDAWATDIKYEKRGKRFLLTSAGPDGEFGTDDDLTNIEKK